MSIFLCCNAGKDNFKAEQHYSETQRYLFQLLDNYKAEYFDSKLLEEKETVRSKFQSKIQYFLVDSLDRSIDSILVSVDTVINDNWLVTTQFHTNDIEFKYGMKFQEDMPPKFDSLYKFMIGLQAGKEVTVDFVLLGGVELYLPDNKTQKILRIFAYPSPSE